MRQGNHITEQDQKIATKPAYLLCVGNLSQASLVSEPYLFDIEREAFLSLSGEK
jgi:3-hydroxyacyl-CoA dehydrogenase